MIKNDERGTPLAIQIYNNTYCQYFCIKCHFQKFCNFPFFGFQKTVACPSPTIRRINQRTIYYWLTILEATNWSIEADQWQTERIGQRKREKRRRLLLNIIINNKNRTNKNNIAATNYHQSTTKTTTGIAKKKRNNARTTRRA